MLNRSIVFNKHYPIHKIQVQVIIWLVTQNKPLDNSTTFQTIITKLTWTFHQICNSFKQFGKIVKKKRQDQAAPSPEPLFSK